MNEKQRENAADANAAQAPSAPAAAAGQGQGQAPQTTAATAGQTPAPAPYALAGEAFTAWFNDRVRRLPNPTVRLGTKSATAVGLHPDGRLECSLHAAAGEAEQQFVAFEAAYLDQLVRKIAALDL